MNRVVVTGLGTINPLGCDIYNFWENIVAGKNATGKITRFDASQFRSQLACEIKNFNPSIYLEKSEIKRSDLFTQYALYSVGQALEDSKLQLDKEDPYSIGVIWGSGQGGMQTYEDEVTKYVKDDFTPKFSPFFIPKLLVNMAAGVISIKYGIQGISYCPVSACATGNTALMDAFNYIKYGKAKVIVTGGSEAAITPASYGGFSALKAMSSRNDHPENASRPLDIGRDGFIMGEGAGALILEDYQHARARGANIYAEIVGAAMTSDAYHITTPDPDGVAAAKCMQLALDEGNVDMSKVDYLNLHATSTQIGDITELTAVNKVFSGSKKLHLSSTKSMTGHLLGAASAIEAIITIKSINEGIVPPNINVTEPDPNIPEGLQIVFNKALHKKINIAMSNAFGFGGHNSTIVFKKFNQK